MKFTFDYRETLERRVVIEAKTLAEAISEVEHRIKDAEIVLDANDFVGGELIMPLEINSFPRLEHNEETVKNSEEFDLVLDCW